MPLTCNIDAKGKRARLVFGLLLIALSLLLGFFWARSSSGWVAWTVSGVVLFWGAFAVFEARAGWCVMRAMGFKTKM